MSVTINGTSGVTFNDASTQNTAATGFGFKNRIINGAMVIDQRNAGASVTAVDGVYTLDRWVASSSIASKYTIQQTPSATETGFATRVGAGFTNYLAATVGASASVTVGSTDYFMISQKIEGFNVADFAWGTANAKTVTLSFWVYSSLTGTFGGALQNSAQNRSYPFSYSIASANTWTQISVTITGDTSGTWLITNGNGMFVRFGLGIGTTYSGTAGAWSGSALYAPTGAVKVIETNSATFYITGVQLEKGSTATSFDYRPYSTELQLAQRYYYRNAPLASGYIYGPAFLLSTTQAQGFIPYPVPMRIKPSALEQSGTAGDYAVYGSVGTTTCTAVPTFSSFTTEYGASLIFTTGATLTAGQSAMLRSLGTTSYLGWSAEL